MNYENLYLKDLIINNLISIGEIKNPVIKADEINTKYCKFEDIFAEHTVTLQNSYLDFGLILRNNWIKRRKGKVMRWRKLFHLNPQKYALTMYNKQRKYIRDKYSFTEWCKLKGIE